LGIFLNLSEIRPNRCRPVSAIPSRIFNFQTVFILRLRIIFSIFCNFWAPFGASRILDQYYNILILYIFKSFSFLFFSLPLLLNAGDFQRLHPPTLSPSIKISLSLSHSKTPLTLPLSLRYSLSLNPSPSIYLSLFSLSLSLNPHSSPFSVSGQGRG